MGNKKYKGRPRKNHGGKRLRMWWLLKSSNCLPSKASKNEGANSATSGHGNDVPYSADNEVPQELVTGQVSEYEYHENEGTNNAPSSHSDDAPCSRDNQVPLQKLDTERVSEDERHKDDVVQGRRFIDIAYLFEKLKLLDNPDPRFGCSFNNLILTREVIRELSYGFIFVCNMCGFKETVWSASDNEPPMDFNAAEEEEAAALTQEDDGVDEDSTMVGRRRSKRLRTKFNSLSGVGVPKPPQNHPENTVVQEAILVKARMRERCLQDRTLRPTNVIEETMSVCTPEVREFLSKYVDVITRDIQIARMEVSQGDEEPKNNLKRKKPSLTSTDKRRKVLNEDTPTADGAGTSAAGGSGISMVYGAGSSTDPLRIPDGLTADPQLTSSPSDKVPATFIKQEGIKEELILEDYELPDSALEETISDEGESSENTTEDQNIVYPSPLKEEPVPFETVMCGNIQIKQEIIEDENDYLSHVHEPAEFTTSKPTAIVENKSVIQGTTEHLWRGYSEGIGRIGSLDAMAKPRSTVTTSSKPADQIHRDNTTLRSTKPSDGQIVFSTQPIISFVTSANKPIYNAASTMVYSSTTSTATNPHVSSATDSPNQPPRDVPLSHISDGEDLEGVYISLKNVPLERRKKAKDKLLKLVKFITDLDVDPDEVNFTFLTKKSVSSLSELMKKKSLTTLSELMKKKSGTSSEPTKKESMSTSSQRMKSTTSDLKKPTSIEPIKSTSSGHVKSTTSDLVGPTSSELIKSTSSEHMKSFLTGLMTNESVSTSSESMETKSLTTLSELMKKKSGTTSSEPTKKESMSTSSQRMKSTTSDLMKPTSVEPIKSTSSGHVKSTTSDLVGPTSSELIKSTSSEHMKSTSTELMTNESASTSSESMETDLASPPIELVKKTSRNICSFGGCGRSRASYPTLHFYTFPVHRPSICDEWVNNCANDASAVTTQKALSKRLVCEKHFEDSCFSNLSKTRLHASAVPSIPSHASDNDNEPT